MKIAVAVLSAFAPHIAEELWQHLGGESSLAYEPFSTIDPKYLEEATATYVVQVNGKLRGKFELPKDQPQEIIVQIAKNSPLIAKHLEGEIKKVIFVPNKLLNFVI